MKKKTAKARFRWYDNISKWTKKKIVDEIVAIAKKNSEEFELLKNLSRYGRTNDAEFFAEVFANSQLGEAERAREGHERMAEAERTD